MSTLTPEEKILFMNYYTLTTKQINDIKHMKNVCGQTIDEISRKFNITPPDVTRVLKPPKDYGKWTAEDKMRHWLAGKKRAQTVKKQRDELQNNTRRETP